jgi:putative heme-binding domain-containing protein
VLLQLLAREKDAPLALSAQLLAARLGLAEVNAGALRARFGAADQPEAIRLQSLDALLAFRDPELLSVLPEMLLSGDPSFRRRVLAMLGRMEEPKLAEVLLGLYGQLAAELQPLTIELLMQREPWARKLLDAVLAKRVPNSALNANHLRKILDSNDREAVWAVEKAFGQVRAERNPEREKVVTEMAVYFREHPGEPKRGQSVFRSLCAQCHTLYGEGGKVGPDLTANGRASFDQLLSNVFDPSLVIGAGYQVVTVVTKDGRNLTGLLAEDNEHRVVVRLPGEGEETVPRHNVKYTRASKLSMMPEGIEQWVDKKELADLFAFLALEQPPGDARAKLIPGAPAFKR